MDKDAKIYITGHSGMVGKTMMQLLEKEGFKNIVTSELEELDLRDTGMVEGFFKEEKPEYVFHFAALVGGIMANINRPYDFLTDNLIINSNVLGMAYKYKVKKLLYLGSSCVYPRESQQPMKEEYLLTGPLEPTNEGYAISKIAGLKQVEYLNKQYGTNFISLMPSNIYGENEHFDPENSHVISSLIMKFHKAKEEKQKDITLWGTGVAKREFTYVTDIAKACLYFMENHSAEDMDNSFINLGTGVDVTIKELAEMIKDIIGFEGEIKWDPSKPDGMPRKLVDVTKMQRLGFKPKIMLQEGIEKTYDYYKTKVLNI